MNAKGLQERVFWGDGTVLYPDCGGGYMNLHTYRSQRTVHTPQCQFYCTLI